jgi:hypothetical protein
MKKLAILALAAILVIAFTVPVSALENEFGGYWRTRFIRQTHFNGQSGKADDDQLERVDTRTRLYYTAKLNDNLKFINKFEYDAVWGGAGTYGRVGADAVAVEVKNSYADFNLGPVNFTVGAQPYVLFRSFQIDADGSGAIARWKAADNFVLAGSWLKIYEGGVGNAENNDVDAYTVTGAFWFSENVKLVPSISYVYTSDVPEAVAAGLGLPVPAAGNLDKASIISYGADFDMTFDKWGLWATAYGQYGEIQFGGNDVTPTGWLAAVGGNVTLSEMFELHGEFVYTPGDGADDPYGNDDSDYGQLINATGSYYWSEIMGLGTFDENASAGGPADVIQNIMFANIGTTITPMEKLSIDLDLWYAELDEDNQTGDNYLGTEVDLAINYQLIEGLNMKLVGAYLFAGDATSSDDRDNSDDPYEIGMQLSLSF